MMQGSKADNNACLHVICYLLNCVAMKQSVADGIKPGQREKKNPSVLAFLCQNIPYRGTSAALESGFFRFYAPPRMPLLPKQRKRTSVRSILASGAETVRFYTNKRQLEIYETDVTNTV